MCGSAASWPTTTAFRSTPSAIAPAACTIRDGARSCDRGLPDDIDIEPIAAGQTLSDLLADGQIDAIYSPRTPRCFTDGVQGAAVFRDFKAEETHYFTRPASSR